MTWPANRWGEGRDDKMQARASAGAVGEEYSWPSQRDSSVPSMVCVLPDGRSQVTFFLKQPWDSREAGDFSDKSSAIEVGASTPGPQ